MQAYLYSPFQDEKAVLTTILQHAGFVVRALQRLEMAARDWPERSADLVLLALPDPREDSTNLIRHLRSQSAAPIVIIVDPQEEAHLVNLVEAGADLLILRPFSTRLLLAHVKGLMRRSGNMPVFGLPSLSRGGVTLDPAARAVKIGDQRARRLTQLEFRLLYTLMIHAGQTLPAERIVEAVWGYEGDGNRDLVRGLVQRLRAKIEQNPREPLFVLTVPGTGYRFNPDL